MVVEEIAADCAGRKLAPSGFPINVTPVKGIRLFKSTFFKVRFPHLCRRALHGADKKKKNDLENIDSLQSIIVIQTKTKNSFFFYFGAESDERFLIKKTAL